MSKIYCLHRDQWVSKEIGSKGLFIFEASYVQRQILGLPETESLPILNQEDDCDMETRT